MALLAVALLGKVPASGAAPAPPQLYLLWLYLLWLYLARYLRAAQHRPRPSSTYYGYTCYGSTWQGACERRSTGPAPGSWLAASDAARSCSMCSVSTAWDLVRGRGKVRVEVRLRGRVEMRLGRG
eukprot:scaffold86872_cov39-Phaeocystis_antarctica.AAC.1